MRISALNEYIESVDYPHAGGVLRIDYNSNAFNSEFFRSLSQGMRRRIAEGKKQEKLLERKWEKSDQTERRLLAIDEEARVIDIERDIYAEMLSCDKGYVLKSWSGTDDNDEPVEPTYENLRMLTPLALKNLFQFLRDYNRPKKQETDTTSASQTTPETTQPSSGQVETSVENQTM